MVRYVWMHEVQKDQEFIDTMFAKNNPDVSWRLPIWASTGAARQSEKYLISMAQREIQLRRGTLFIHTLTTPIIEIAEDGQGSSLKEPTTYDIPFTTIYVPELLPAPPEPTGHSVKPLPTASLQQKIRVINEVDREMSYNIRNIS